MCFVKNTNILHGLLHVHLVASCGLATIPDIQTAKHSLSQECHVCVDSLALLDVCVCVNIAATPQHSPECVSDIGEE